MLAKSAIRSFSQSSVAGVTLIELLITIAILGILTSIVIPSYSGYLNKSRRTDAKIALNNAVKNMERCFVTHNQYDHASCASYPAAGVKRVLSDEGHYKIVATTLTETTFVLTATPVATSPQSKDTYCQQFSIDSTGNRNATNADCW
jgi:type IV pilus assembly protein PilE